MEVPEAIAISRLLPRRVHAFLYLVGDVEQDLSLGGNVLPFRALDREHPAVGKDIVERTRRGADWDAKRHQVPEVAGLRGRQAWRRALEARCLGDPDLRDLFTHRSKVEVSAVRAPSGYGDLGVRYEKRLSHQGSIRPRGNRDLKLPRLPRAKRDFPPVR